MCQVAFVRIGRNTSFVVFLFKVGPVFLWSVEPTLDPTTQEYVSAGVNGNVCLL